MKKKELFWFLGTCGLSAFFSILTIGKSGFNLDSTLDINIHDTYLVFSKFHLILPILILTFFCIYVLRTFRRNFRNLIANLILILSTIFLIVLLNGVSSIIDSIISENSGWTIYPPLSAGIDIPTIEEIEKEERPLVHMFRIFSKIALLTQVLLLILLTYCGFKSGQNFKYIKYDNIRNEK